MVQTQQTGPLTLHFLVPSKATCCSTLIFPICSGSIRRYLWPFAAVLDPMHLGRATILVR